MSAVIETSRLNHSTCFRRRSYAAFVDENGGLSFETE